MVDMIASDPLKFFAAGAFLFLLGAASVADVRERRIPNRLVMGLLVGGLLATLAIAGPSAMGRSLLAAAIGFVIWIPFYVLRMLGAGDVKLFAAAAAWLAPFQVIDAALLAAFVGGALSVIWILRESPNGAGIIRILHAARYRQVLVTATQRRKLPYGVAMSIGLSLSFFGIGFLR